MSRVRLTLLSVFCVAAMLWSFWVLAAQYVRLEHRALLNSIRAGRAAVDFSAIDNAIAAYDSAMRLLPCSRGLQDDQLLMNSVAADWAVAYPEQADADVYLAQSLDVLSAHLSCNPTDGKAWLNLAAINTYREGFTERSLAALVMSEKVAPGESWLCSKRLVFALQFLPMLSREARDASLRDIAVLKDRAHPKWLLSVKRAAAVDTPEELELLFR